MSALDLLAKSNFDGALIKENEVLVINVDRDKLKNKNFRINERIFREEMQFVKPDSSTKALADSDVFGVDTSHLKTYGDKENMKFKENSEVVIKLNRQRESTATQLGGQNFYLKQHLNNK